MAKVSLPYLFYLSDNSMFLSVYPYLKVKKWSLSFFQRQRPYNVADLTGWMLVKKREAVQPPADNLLVRIGYFCVCSALSKIA